MAKQVVKEEINLARDWLLSSGIQNSSGERQGGFNSWYDFKEKAYSYVYSEITGYGITSLLYMEKKFNDNSCLDKAVSAADWLMKKALHPCGGVKARDYYQTMEDSEHYSFDSENIYTFDNGMVLYGMVNLYKETGDKQYLDFSVRIGKFLTEEMMKEDGLFYAIYDAKNNEKDDIAWKWSSQSGSYHCKLTLGFTDLYEVTQNEVYKKAVFDISNASLSFQMDEGRFVTSRADGSTHLHPHSYSAEGLVYAGVYFGENSFINSALKAVKWALDNQAEDGGIPKKFNGKEFISYYRSDVLAQVLRLGTILYSLGKLDESYVPKLRNLREKLILSQHIKNDSQDGGFIYGTTLDGKYRDHVNSWCTMFALQALIMYDEVFEKGEKSLGLECFV